MNKRHIQWKSPTNIGTKNTCNSDASRMTVLEYASQASKTVRKLSGKIFDTIELAVNKDFGIVHSAQFSIDEVSEVFMYDPNHWKGMHEDLVASRLMTDTGIRKVIAKIITERQRTNSEDMAKKNSNEVIASAREYQSPGDILKRRSMLQRISCVSSGVSPRSPSMMKIDIGQEHQRHTWLQRYPYRLSGSKGSQ